MPPQPGMFSLPYPSKPRPAYPADVEIGIGIGYGHAVGHGHAAIAGSRIPGVFQASYAFVPFGSYVCLRRALTSCWRTGISLDDAKKDRRKKEISGKLGKEMSDRREE